MRTIVRYVAEQRGRKQLSSLEELSEKWEDMKGSPLDVGGAIEIEKQAERKIPVNQ